MNTPLIWQYSRNRGRHFCSDGEKYGRDQRDLFEIVDNRPYGSTHRPMDGYTLYHKGEKISFGLHVSFLKKKAEEIKP